MSLCHLIRATGESIALDFFPGGFERIEAFWRKWEGVDLDGSYFPIRYLSISFRLVK